MLKPEIPFCRSFSNQVISIPFDLNDTYRVEEPKCNESPRKESPTCGSYSSSRSEILNMNMSILSYYIHCRVSGSLILLVHIIAKRLTNSAHSHSTFSKSIHNSTNNSHWLKKHQRCRLQLMVDN